MLTVLLQGQSVAHIPVGGGEGEFFPIVNNASNSIIFWIIAKILMKHVTCS